MKRVLLILAIVTIGVSVAPAQSQVKKSTVPGITNFALRGKEITELLQFRSFGFDSVAADRRSLDVRVGTLIELDSGGLALELNVELGDRRQSEVDLFPSSDAVIARRDAGELELAVGVGGVRPGEIGDSFHGNTGRPERYLDIGHRHSIRTMHDSADISGVR